MVSLLKLLFDITLIAMGLIGAEGVVGEAIPATKNVIARLKPQQTMLGFIGLLLGVVYLIEWFSYLGFLSFAPITALVSLVIIILDLALGLIFGLDFIKSNLKSSAAALAKIEEFRTKLLPYQAQMSVAAIIFGVLKLLSWFTAMTSFAAYKIY